MKKKSFYDIHQIFSIFRDEYIFSKCIFFQTCKWAQMQSILFVLLWENVVLFDLNKSFCLATHGFARNLIIKNIYFIYVYYLCMQRNRVSSTKAGDQKSTFWWMKEMETNEHRTANRNQKNYNEMKLENVHWIFNPERIRYMYYKVQAGSGAITN